MDGSHGVLESLLLVIDVTRRSATEEVRLEAGADEICDKGKNNEKVVAKSPRSRSCDGGWG